MVRPARNRGFGLLALAAVLAVIVLSGCKVGGESSAADTEWGQIAQDEGWLALSDEEFDGLLDSFVQENAAFVAEVQLQYLEPMAIVIGSVAEDPENWSAEPHLIAFDGTPEGTAGAMRELGGLVARSGQRPLAVLLIAEADPGDGTVLPGPGDGESASTDSTPTGPSIRAERAVLTMGMTVDGRVNRALQMVSTAADGTTTVGDPSDVVHAAEQGDLQSELLAAFYEGYVQVRSE